MSDLTHEELLPLTVIDYDGTKYNFRALVQRMLSHDNLEKIHQKDGSSNLDFKEDQSSQFHKAYYESELLEEMIELYKAFIKDVVAPQVKGDYFVYQAKPTFRVHSPGGIAVGEKHKDSQYNHPFGEVNYWLPFTKVMSNNGFFVEKTEDKGDFAHIPDMVPGQVLRFNGNRLTHYNEPNTTDETRISFDFRIIPGHMYKASHHTSVKSNMTFSLGSYFAGFDRTTNSFFNKEEYLTKFQK